MLKEDDLVLCTVKSMEGTTVFLEIEGYGKATLSLSEIAAGRIRNLREYVSPNKKIVCKVLRIVDSHPQLSLRRVTAKERESVLNKYQKERTFISLTKTISKDSEKVLEKIKKDYDLADFYDEAKENPKIIEKYFSKEETEKMSRILSEKKEKEKEVKKIISIKSFSDSGTKDIKEILNIKDTEIHYLGSSKFSITAKAKDFKEANIKVLSIIQEIEKRAKEKKAILEIIN